VKLGVRLRPYCSLDDLGFGACVKGRRVIGDGRSAAGAWKIVLWKMDLVLGRGNARKRFAK